MYTGVEERMNLYFISGLAADERMFARLRFPAHINPVFLPWLKPLSKKESLNSYVHRMAEGIDQTKPFVLMGLSFGGMVCCELNSFLKPQKTILISSVSSPKCFPPWFGWVKKMHLEKTLRSRVLKAMPAVINDYVFGATSTACKALLADMVRKADDELLIWSIRQVINWKPDTFIPNLIQIHGSKDKVFPIQYVQATHVLPGGSHLTVFENAAEMNSLLSRLLSQ